MNYTWIASLSDGQRLSMRDLITGDGINPWDKAVIYGKNHNLAITHLEIIVNGRRYNSPSNSKNSRFYTNEKVNNFWVFYREEANISPEQESENYIAYSYKLGEYRHFFWINQNNCFCYSQIVNVINPKTKLEQEYAGIENFINNMYSG